MMIVEKRKQGKVELKRKWEKECKIAQFDVQKTKQYKHIKM
jgi:hypothetical protein